MLKKVPFLLLFFIILTCSQEEEDSNSQSTIDSQSKIERGEFQETYKNQVFYNDEAARLLFGLSESETRVVQPRYITFYDSNYFLRMREYFSSFIIDAEYYIKNTVDTRGYDSCKIDITNSMIDRVEDNSSSRLKFMLKETLYIPIGDIYQVVFGGDGPNCRVSENVLVPVDGMLLEKVDNGIRLSVLDSKGEIISDGDCYKGGTMQKTYILTSSAPENIIPFSDC